MEKMTSFRIIILLAGLFKIISADKHCVMSTFHLSCTFDISENRSLSIHKTDIKTLDLSGSVLNELVRLFVKEYINVEELNLSNCRIRHIENGTFSDLYKLVKLNLSDNLMKSFNTDSFQQPNALSVLILSNNLLTHLDSFPFENFPKLRALDISGNGLTYLSESVIHVIITNSFMTFHADRNPWDCQDSHWKAYLDKSQYLRRSFCVTNFPSALANFRSKSKYNNGLYTSTDNCSRPRETCGFSRCK
ncbi:hypothetical protein HHI36_019529 [Cryptolaemus montrouzieri]|uniref:Uncharacterized protein n=1 Tax=Cryptolaemus montrouzieri TaxID=559131 RepID=A0ABD2P3B8_9CUCU